MEIGFIILRHMRDERTSRFWYESYSCIRKYYPENPIMIIDDNSDSRFINRDFEGGLKNVIFIQSEYPGRGELLPFIYYLRNRFCEKVVIIHDSVFFNCLIDFYVDDYSFLWYFESRVIENREKEIGLLSIYGDKSLVDIYNSKNWVGCFGLMMVISYEFLEKVNSKYNLEKLIDKIKGRCDRQYLERALAIILQRLKYQRSLLGDILKYCKWGGLYKEMYLHLPIIKVWSGR